MLGSLSSVPMVSATDPPVVTYMYNTFLRNFFSYTIGIHHPFVCCQSCTLSIYTKHGFTHHFTRVPQLNDIFLDRDFFSDRGQGEWFLLKLLTCIGKPRRICPSPAPCQQQLQPLTKKPVSSLNQTCFALNELLTISSANGIPAN